MKQAPTFFRINMSHTSHDVMRTLITRIRAVESRSGRPIGILADLQAANLRVGKFANTKVTLVPGQSFTLDSNEALGDERASSCRILKSSMPSRQATGC